MIKKPVVRLIEEEKGSRAQSIISEEIPEYSSTKGTHKTGHFTREEEQESFNEQKWAEERVQQAQKETIMQKISHQRYHTGGTTESEGVVRTDEEYFSRAS